MRSVIALNRARFDASSTTGGRRKPGQRVEAMPSQEGVVKAGIAEQRRIEHDHSRLLAPQQLILPEPVHHVVAEDHEPHLEGHAHPQVMHEPSKRS